MRSYNEKRGWNRRSKKDEYIRYNWLRWYAWWVFIANIRWDLFVKEMNMKNLMRLAVMSAKNDELYEICYEENDILRSIIIMISMEIISWWEKCWYQVSKFKCEKIWWYLEMKEIKFLTRCKRNQAEIIIKRYWYNWFVSISGRWINWND